jgi:hypothetical protein
MSFSLPAMWGEFLIRPASWGEFLIRLLRERIFNSPAVGRIKNSPHTTKVEPSRRNLGYATGELKIRSTPKLGLREEPLHR